MKKLLMISLFGAVLVFSLFVTLFDFRLTGNVISEETTSKTTTYIYGGNLLASKTNGVTEYYVQDHLGSNRKVTDGSEFDSFAFGETKNLAGENNYLYTGKEKDSETGLYYYGARYYSPELGRFVAADALKGSLQDPLSMNRYSYVKNNPLKYVDPTGNVIETVGDNTDKFLETVNGLLGQDAFVEVSKWYWLGDEIGMSETPYEGNKEQMKIYNLVKRLIESDHVIEVTIGDLEYYVGPYGGNQYSESVHKETGEVKASSRQIHLSGKNEDLGSLLKDFGTYETSPAASLLHELGHADGEGEEGAVKYENIANRLEGRLERYWYYTEFYPIDLDSGEFVHIWKGINPAQKDTLNGRYGEFEYDPNRGETWDTLYYNEQEGVWK